MKFTFLSLFPEMIDSALSYGVVGQAFQNHLIEKDFIHPRDFTSNVHKTVDDRPFGGGDGMVMMAEPLGKALDDYFLKSDGKKPFVLSMSPQGKLLNSELIKKLLSENHLLFVCGRYGGIDQRFINQYVDLEVSIGDFILSGGEIPAVAITDALVRQIPGVLGHNDSATQDSFAGSWGGLESPQFTRPRVWRDAEVPEILLGGHHLKQQQFKAALSFLITHKKRIDLIEKAMIDGVITKKNLELAVKELKVLSDQELASLGLTQNDIGEFNKWTERTKISLK